MTGSLRSFEAENSTPAVEGSVEGSQGQQTSPSTQELREAVRPSTEGRHLCPGQGEEPRHSSCCLRRLERDTQKTGNKTRDHTNAE